MNRVRSNPFLHLKKNTRLDLSNSGSFPDAGHLWSQPEIDALTAAYAASRPLLVRGEAGCGKSQIARAAASVMGKTDPLYEVIHPRFEALDLLYRFDAVERIADAEIQELDRTNVKYVSKGKLWEAIDRGKAADFPPVLLIDEIDKADADLPNALLDVLGNRSFTVPHYRPPEVIRAADGKHPMVIITTNEERELPAAFVRRCFVLNLNPPQDDQAFVNWLVERGEVHKLLDIAPDVRQTAAEQVLKDRKAAQDANYPPVGLAEYIDLLTALHELTSHLPDAKRPGSQQEWLAKIHPYALKKNKDQDQSLPTQERGAAEL